MNTYGFWFWFRCFVVGVVLGFFVERVEAQSEGGTVVTLQNFSDGGVQIDVADGETNVASGTLGFTSGALLAPGQTSSAVIPLGDLPNLSTFFYAGGGSYVSGYAPHPSGDPDSPQYYFAVYGSAAGGYSLQQGDSPFSYGASGTPGVAASASVASGLVYVAVAALAVAGLLAGVAVWRKVSKYWGKTA